MITILLEKIKALLTELKTTLNEKNFGEPFYTDEAVAVGKWFDGRTVYKRCEHRTYNSDTSFSYWEITIPENAYFIGFDPRATFFDCMPNSTYGDNKPTSRYTLGSSNTTTAYMLKVGYDQNSNPYKATIGLGSNTMYHVRNVVVSFYYVA